jgi:hypothetical protein
MRKNVAEPYEDLLSVWCAMGSFLDSLPHEVGWLVWCEESFLLQIRSNVGYWISMMPLRRGVSERIKRIPIKSARERMARARTTVKDCQFIVVLISSSFGSWCLSARESTTAHLRGHSDSETPLALKRERVDLPGLGPNGLLVKRPAEELLGDGLLTSW